MRAKIGRSIHGWRPYGAWAYAPEGADGEYLLDDAPRLLVDSEARDGALAAGESIKRIRGRLRNPRAVLRLVGLSGVGKTRFVQALFDSRVGENSLDPSLACYTNLADGPDPSPTIVAADLLASHRRAVLIVDNCPSDLHQRLSEQCRSPESLLSLATVEYDIREDQPEETDVFRLQPSSIDLMGKLVKSRFPEISPVDARTVADFSGGNARIAIALAGTIGKNESIAGLRDDELFRRLFQQRNEPSQSLLLAAQALSLVYSFQGEDVSDSPEAELGRLGALIGKNAEEMFQHVAELERRGLIQRRGRWRAVLPHAVANRLATMALQNIPFAATEEHLVNGGPARLLKSFSRRLGYLDASREAQSIVTRWLEPRGLLSDLVSLNDLEYAMFNNIAPVAPRDTLLALERVLLEPKDGEGTARCKRYLYILRSLAYDPALFERSVALIVKIGETGNAEDDANEAGRVFASLFPIYLSGTHATIEQRLAVIKSLVLAGDRKKRAVGLMALRAMLEASQFGPAYNFEFGARSRDYGYQPKCRDDVKQWFGQTLTFAENLASSDEPLASEARAVIAQQFRGLWTAAEAYDDLDRVCRSISSKNFWTGGWIAVRETMVYDGAGFNTGTSARLTALEELLRPKDIVQKVRSIVLSEAVTYVGIDSTDSNDIEQNLLKVEAAAHELGKAAARDQEAFGKLMPELIAGNSQQLWNFGGGLAEGAENQGEMWRQLISHLAAAPPDKKGIQVFRGFLNHLRVTNPKLMNALLDDALENETLAPWYPALQTAAGIDDMGVKRLMRSLEIGKARIGIYRHLMSGGVTHQIRGRDFNNLLLRIAKEPGGWGIAMDILGMRLSFARSQSSSEELIDLGCDLMRQLKFTESRNTVADYRLGMIGRSCLIGDKGAATVREMCLALRGAISRSETYAAQHRDLLQVLLGAQPVAALEALCGGRAEDLKIGMSILEYTQQLLSKPFDKFPESDLLNWCDQLPEVRYPAVAGGITAFRPSDEAARPQWTATARKLLDRSPDPVAVLKKFIGQFSPPGWAGSRAAIVESNAKLLDDFNEHPDPAVRRFIEEEKIRLANGIKAEMQTEILFDRERDERFE